MYHNRRFDGGDRDDLGVRDCRLGYGAQQTDHCALAGTEAVASAAVAPRIEYDSRSAK
jgi:hypothetical protein